MNSIPDPSNTVSSPNSSIAMPGPPQLRPTWVGYVADTRDALLLFESALQGRISRVVRRPHDRERSSMIKSGSVFIYAEDASGIKRWTDGVAWSPSRILNNFLIYRELEKPFPPGEKKRATKKTKRDPRPGDPDPRTLSGDELRVSLSPPAAGASSTSPLTTTSSLSRTDTNSDREAERSLVGSLTDSYAFKAGGLVKKTMSVKVSDSSFHLVSYYNPEDVKAGLLVRPCDDEKVQSIGIRSELLSRQNFRTPLEDEAEESSTQSAYRVQSQTQVPFGNPMYHLSPPHLSPPSHAQYYNQQIPVQYAPQAQTQTQPLPYQYGESSHNRLPRPVPQSAAVPPTSYYGQTPSAAAPHYSSYDEQRPPAQYNPRSMYSYPHWQDPTSQ